MSILSILIDTLDDDHGVSESTYNEIYDCIRHHYGAEAAAILSANVDACEGRFYISEGYAGDLTERIANCKKEEAC